jgi:hypothetical protein
MPAAVLGSIAVPLEHRRKIVSIIPVALRTEFVSKRAPAATDVLLDYQLWGIAKPVKE